jgi:hypothetical protein
MCVLLAVRDGFGFLMAGLGDETVGMGGSGRAGRCFVVLIVYFGFLCMGMGIGNYGMFLRICEPQSGKQWWFDLGKCLGLGLGVWNAFG